MTNANSGLINTLSDYINYHVNSSYQDSEIKRNIVKNISDLTFDNYIYDNDSVITDYDIANFLKDTSKLNEINEDRKSMGIYYTPEDISNFMALNALLDNFKKDRNKLYDYEEFNINNIKNKIGIKDMTNKKVMDPTCGNSEFLISIIKSKIKILDGKHDFKDIIKISENLYGNDININAIIISKVRIFLLLISLIDKNELNIEVLNTIKTNIDNNFTNKNILLDYQFNNKFDIIIGNPPYVETSKYPIKLDKRYGNIYANILDLSLNLLDEKGILAFIIPISYVSTVRMKKIRNVVQNKSGKQVILNFADRPDSLFSAAHQKLSIVFIENSKTEGDVKEVYTSNYQYWYKEERIDLFKNIDIMYNEHITEDFIPKLGNKLDLNIYIKIKPSEGKSIYDYLIDKKNNEDSIHLNMRATFWIKSFLHNGISKEYKRISCSTKEKHYLYCIFNSSLFFWYWTVVSDCWHITNKEFRNFRLITDLDNILYNKFEKLSYKLSKELEDTKVYVGTKQTDYEYKHKECKSIIDEIDKELANIYGLTDDELKYVQNFAIRYRESRGPKK